MNMLKLISGYIQWLEIKEAKERDEYRRKREREHEMKEIKFKVRFEEERQKIRKELQSKKED